MRVFSVIILFIFLYLSCLSQDQNKIDSLQEVINRIESSNKTPCAADTGIINAYILWGDEFILSNPDSTLRLNEKAKLIAEKLLDTKPSGSVNRVTKEYISVALNNIGYIYNDR